MTSLVQVMESAVLRLSRVTLFNGVAQEGGAIFIFGKVRAGHLRLKLR